MLASLLASLAESSSVKLSDTYILVTLPSTFILEKLLSALTSARFGSEKVNSTLGDDTADGTECEGGGLESQNKINDAA